jgi:hypothetical protein
MTGKVVQFYTMEPKSVKLKGLPGEKITETIRIIFDQTHTFRIQEITAKRGENIRFQYKEFNDGDSSGYEVVVENLAVTPGVYFDTLYLKTDSDIKPKISISVVGSIRNPSDPAMKSADEAAKKMKGG